MGEAPERPAGRTIANKFASLLRQGREPDILIRGKGSFYGKFALFGKLISCMIELS